jgi:hypothetical protein
VVLLDLFLICCGFHFTWTWLPIGIFSSFKRNGTFHRIAEFFLNGLTANGLESFPTSRLTTYVDADGVGSSIDYWLGNSLINITNVVTGGSLSAQHCPLTATIEWRHPIGRFSLRLLFTWLGFCFIIEIWNFNLLKIQFRSPSGHASESPKFFLPRHRVRRYSSETSSPRP